jgi:hypothetical protein
MLALQTAATKAVEVKNLVKKGWSKSQIARARDKPWINDWNAEII